MQNGRNEILIGVAVLAVALLIVVPIVLSSGKKGKREQVKANVEALRQAQLQYHEAFPADGYVSAEAAPRSAHEVDAIAIEWVATDGFRRLSWAPDNEAEVFGSFQVQADRDGFKVTGTCDVDGDGERAVFEATHDQEVTLVTAAGIY